MKAKQFVTPLILFILGIIFTILGALFKIQHWQFASEILTIGALLEVLGLLVLIFILIKYYMKK